MSTIHHIVQLDGHIEIPKPDFEHKWTKYPTTTKDQVAERIEDATIVIATGVQLSYETLIKSGPKLQLLASLGVGYDNINIEAVKERGLMVVNVPAQNTDSVTEHAFALYAAIKRNIVPLHSWTIGGNWDKSGIGAMNQFKRIPKTNKEETLGVVGYGALGKSAEKMAKALGMEVLVAERKGASEPREGRMLFEDVIKKCTVLIMTCPLDASTRNMIGEPELRTMREDAIVVNVGRGGIINELALTNALREYRIAGAATDVFETEPATRENCPLLDTSIPNLVLTPHIAWLSTGTIKGTQQETRKNLEMFVAGTPQNVVAGGAKRD